MAEGKKAVSELLRSTMIESISMGIFQKGDHVKFEVAKETSGESEWMWLLVEHSDDEQEIVFGKLDSQPVIATDMGVGQELAVSYERVRDHRRFGRVNLV